jgi:type I restriction enzyme S subunit
MDGRRKVEMTGRSLSQAGVAILNRVLVPHGVAVSCIGWQMGKALLIDRPVISNQQINSIIPDSSVVDDLFLYYALTEKRREIFTRGAGGSRTPILNKSGFEDIIINLPPQSEQRHIAHTLGTLDDKIELNRQMTETLEGMARALFKSWFVDFDPVRAKAEGRDPGLPQLVADLFPSLYEDSDVGIPKGWRISSIGELAQVIDCLHSKKPERLTSGRPLLQLWNIRNNALLDLSDPYYISESDYAEWVSRMEATTGDCVITNVGRVGAVAQIPVGVKAALGRNMTALRCRAEYPFPTFLVQALTSDAMRAEIELRKDSGTILDALNVRNIPKLRVSVPQSPTLLEQFERVCRPIRARMETCFSESETMGNLRDTLLPKLMAGELRIRDAEGMVARSV